MSEYFPDRWVIIKIEGTKVAKTYYRVFASWYGGFGGSDSWKMSSGIESVTYDPIKEQYTMPQSSGSVYKVNASSHGFSMYGFSVYSNYADQNSEECKISVMDENFDLASVL